MSYWQTYCYVDAHYEHPVKKRFKPWERLPASEVSRRIVAKARSSNCFATIQRFKDATSLLELRREVDARAKRERSSNGADREELERAAAAAEADELPDGQMHYCGLFFDFDCDPEREKITQLEAVARSQADCIKLAHWFLEVFELNKAHVQVWFSGCKGFHLLVRPEPFGIKPHMHLTYIIRSAAMELATELKLGTLDQSVYSARRMWRIPNTLHPRTGRYKYELSVDELFGWSVDEVWERSKGPRTDTGEKASPNSHVWDEPEYKEISPEELAVEWWNDRYHQIDAYMDLKRLRPRRPIRAPLGAAADKWPVCIKDILENGPKDGGPNRNRVLLPLAGFMSDAGLGQEEAGQLVNEWTESFYPAPRQLTQRQANGRSVVEAAYSGNTSFACRFIRSVAGTGESGRVACIGETDCPWIADPDDQQPMEVPLIHLSEASKGCYVGTQVRTAIHVAAKATRRYELPVKGWIECAPDPEAKICANCPNNSNDGANGQLEYSLNAEDRHVLNMINVTDNIRKGALKSRCGIPVKCYRNTIHISESSNVEELQIIPMVDYAQAYMEQPDSDDDPNHRHLEHVVEVGYHMGHGIEANKKYIIEATVLGHPKDQRVCFLFDKSEPAQNDIDQFRMTDELRRKLVIFQPSKEQTVSQKLQEIHRDLTCNVHQIGGRFELSIAVDLCYHSVIGFTFASKFIHKGWFELLVVGDTGTGKTTMIERMMQHYGLGELIAGEDSKRTGLVYASIQVQGQWLLRWGKIPQNDRRLLIIDEFAGIPPEEIGKMTQLRSEGKARGGGVNSDHETWARTRLIFLTNPRQNRGSLGPYNYGIQAVKDIFGEEQDLRRVDLAVTAEKEEVASEFIHKRWDRVDLPHRYTADLCRNLVLWAWSREPHHIKWATDAEDEVIKWAERLGDTYECDLPLAERADLRFKIARISAAVAARLFSTDKDAKNLYVKAIHVEFAAQFMDRLYRKGSMSYFEYARKFKQDNHFTEEKKVLIRETLETFGDEHDSVVSTLLDVDLLTKPLFADMVNLENDELKRLWKFLVKQRLLRKTTKGYRKTGAFTKFIKAMGAKPSGYQSELGDDFESGGSFIENDTDPFTETTDETGQDLEDAPF